MAHTTQERWATLVDAKLRSQLVTRDNLIFNNRYEGDPKAGKVKIPVRDTEVAVKTYNKSKGVDASEGSTAYIDLSIDHDEADIFDQRRLLLSVRRTGLFLHRYPRTGIR